jgi:hypothetical protein
VFEIATDKTAIAKAALCLEFRRTLFLKLRRTEWQLRRRIVFGIATDRMAIAKAALCLELRRTEWQLVTSTTASILRQMVTKMR